MENFLTIAEKIFVLFALMMTGFALGKLKLIEPAGESVLANISLFISVPSVIIMSFQRDFDRSLLNGLLLTALIIAGVLIFGILVSHFAIRGDTPGKRGVLKYAAIFPNLGFITLPIVHTLYGAEGVFYVSVCIVICTMLYWTYGYYIMSNSSEKLPLRKILLNAGTVSMAVGLVLFLTSTKLPEPVADIGSNLAALNTPLGMFVIGSLLSRSKISSLFKEKGIWVSAALRLLILPLCTVLFLMAFKITGLASVICVIASCAPAALTTAMFAVRFKHDEEPAAKIVAVQTVLSLITMPFFIYFAQAALS